MPAYYNHRPLTPPEYSTGFTNQSCSAYPPRIQVPAFGARQQQAHREEVAYDYSGYNQFNQPAQVATLPSHQRLPSHVAGMNRYPYPEPVGLPLPSVHTLDQTMYKEPYLPPPPAYRQHEQQTHQKTKEEKPVGGVSAKLDYDMEWMTDFVAETAQNLVQPARLAQGQFRTWINSVLCATRLPSSTIVLSMLYLQNRLDQLRAQGRADARSENFICRVLTVSLIMGSKFLDDNTFINRSWADVSGIDIKTLNEMEMEWLEATGWRLHLDPSDGFNTWMQNWRTFESRCVSRGAHSLKLSPLDTSVQRDLHAHKSYASPSALPSFTLLSAMDYSARPYNTPAYASYDPWLVRRSADAASPESAPHTGPTTPEYYGGPGTWAPLDGGIHSFSRRAYGMSHVAQPQAAPYTPFTPAYNYYNSVAGHSIHCRCICCSRQPLSYCGPHLLQQSIAA